MKKIAVIMGSYSDWDVIRPCVELLEDWGIPSEVHVFSAHRTPDEAGLFAATARENDFAVLIAAAGMAAHLAGALAARTSLPVIGIPVLSKSLGGLDALLSTVQMPGGIPVATVAVNGAKNAAFLAMQMLAITDKDLAERLERERRRMAAEVLQKDGELQELLRTRTEEMKK